MPLAAARHRSRMARAPLAWHSDSPPTRVAPASDHPHRSRLPRHRRHCLRTCLAAVTAPASAPAVRRRSGSAPQASERLPLPVASLHLARISQLRAPPWRVIRHLPHLHKRLVEIHRPHSSRSMLQPLAAQHHSTPPPLAARETARLAPPLARPPRSPPRLQQQSLHCRSSRPHRRPSLSRHWPHQCLHSMRPLVRRRLRRRSASHPRPRLQPRRQLRTARRRTRPACPVASAVVVR